MKKIRLVYSKNKKGDKKMKKVKCLHSNNDYLEIYEENLSYVFEIKSGDKQQELEVYVNKDTLVEIKNFIEELLK